MSYDNNFKKKMDDYIPAEDRLLSFANDPHYKNWSVLSDIVKFDEVNIIVKSTIIDDKGVVRATGLSHVYRDGDEKKLEQCESSAKARALITLGFASKKSKNYNYSEQQLTVGSNIDEFEAGLAESKMATQAPIRDESVMVTCNNHDANMDRKDALKEKGFKFNKDIQKWQKQMSRSEYKSLESFFVKIYGNASEVKQYVTI